MLIGALAIRWQALKFAGGTALVLCGDWNIKPHDAPYKMLTGAGLPTGLEMPRYDRSRRIAPCRLA